MKLLDLLQNNTLPREPSSVRWPRGWRARVKPALRSSSVDIGIPTDALERLTETWPRPADLGPPVGELSPLDVCVGPFWRSGTRDWYVQFAADFDAPCRNCLNSAQQDGCHHKSPATAAIEASFRDVQTVLDVLGRFALEPSGFDNGRFIQRDLTVVMTGRRGLELRFERLMTPAVAEGVAEMLTRMQDELPTLDVGATRDLRRPRRGVLSQHPGDGEDRQGLRLPLDPDLAPQTAEDWRELQVRLVEWAKSLRGGNAPQESLPGNLVEKFRSVWLPVLEAPDRGPDRWRDFHERFGENVGESRPTDTGNGGVDDERLERISEVCAEAGLRPKQATDYGILPVTCPRCGRKTGYLNASLLLRCHRPKCDAWKVEGGMQFPRWTDGATQLTNPRYTRARLTRDCGGADAVDRLTERVAGLRNENGGHDIELAEPIGAWWSLRVLHVHPKIPSDDLRDIQAGIEALPALGEDDLKGKDGAGPTYIGRGDWREFLPVLKGVDRAHLEIFRGYVWCTLSDGGRYILEPTILAELKTVQRALIGLDRLVVSTLDDIRWLLGHGWSPQGLFDSNFWTVEIPVRLLNKQQSSAGLNGDALNRWRLAHHFASSTDSPLDVSALLGEKLEDEGLMKTAAREHRSLIPSLVTERPKFSVDLRALRQMLRADDSRLEDARRRIQNFLGPFANQNNLENVRERLSQDGIVLSEVTSRAVETVVDQTGISAPAHVPLEALQTRLELQPRLTATRSILRATNDDEHLDLEVDPLGACTGRLSSREPNLMGLDHHLRQYFQPVAGRLLLSCDFSQIQIRILADCSGDPRMLDAFREDQDIHRFVAGEVFQTSADGVSDDQRSAAKAVSMGVIMGMGAEALANYATDVCGVETSTSEARAILDGYFDSFPQVRRFRRRLYERAKDEGHLRARSGRRCLLPDFGELHPGQVLAYLLQMTEADILKDTVALLYEQLPSETASIVCLLHDEIVLEADAQHGEIGAVLEAAMTEAAEQHLESCPPGGSETVFGETWADLD